MQHDYAFGGPEEIDRAIGIMTRLDAAQVNAIVELEIDSAIDELQTEYEKSTADPAYRPSDDFIVRLSNYLSLEHRVVD